MLDFWTIQTTSTLSHHCDEFRKQDCIFTSTGSAETYNHDLKQNIRTKGCIRELRTDLQRYHAELWARVERAVTKQKHDSQAQVPEFVLLRKQAALDRDRTATKRDKRLASAKDAAEKVRVLVMELRYTINSF